VTPVVPLEDAVVRLRSRIGDLRAWGVARLALFGLVSMGRPRPDGDALVSFASGEKSDGGFLDVVVLLEAVLGRSVELVVLSPLSPILAPEMLADKQHVLRAV